MDAAQARAYLFSLEKFGMVFGLERMQRLLAALGNPERAYRVLHVAGTNGKGSTCAFAASMLERAGLKVGLYTSPHLVRFEERIRVGSGEIEEQQLVEGVGQVRRAMSEAGLEAQPVTFFEFTTALALWHFARERVDAVVLEVGLGGRLDATNAVQSAVSAIAHIGLDHTAILGDTLGKIAAEKAGIFKPGSVPVVARQPAEALESIEARATALGLQPRIAGRDFWLEGDGPWCFRSGTLRFEGLRLPLAGPHQLENAETAIEAARLVTARLGEAAVREGLEATRWPGRLELVDTRPPTLLDGAHNPDGAKALARAVRKLYPGARIHLVFGVLADKDVSGVASELLPLAARLHLCSPKNDRALGTSALRELAVSLGASAPAVYPSVVDALTEARRLAREESALVLVAGSLYVVGEARALLAV